MASVTIKGIPDNLLSSLRAHAAAEKRSMNKDVIGLLETALSGRNSNQAERQIAEWSKLAGRWISDLETDEEIADIYASRTAGREINF
jgi:plasmid stability protein